MQIILIFYIICVVLSGIVAGYAIYQDKKGTSINEFLKMLFLVIMPVINFIIIAVGFQGFIEGSNFMNKKYFVRKD